MSSIQTRQLVHSKALPGWAKDIGGLRRCLRVLMAAVAIVLTGCAGTSPRLNPLPQTFEDDATIVGVPGARYWGDRTPEGFARWLALPEAALRERYGGIMDRPHNYLVLSGGGEDGAFGAGLLAGWSAAGNRPEFQIVTGVSTGALIAPFAFLGSGYDRQLEEVFTSYTSNDLMEIRSLFSILGGDAAADAAPLRRLLETYISDEMVRAIAAEGRRGRSLLIGTTNLEAARPVTWDLTRIAMSGLPNAGRLIQQVILASASVPGAFSPVLIDVEAQGKHYQEVHVDGGVTSQLFLSPTGIDWKRMTERLRVVGTPQLYVIRNSRLSPSWESVSLRLVPILGRTVSTLIRTQGVGDLAQVFILTQRDGIGFNLAHIPRDFAELPKEPFDRDYMRTLFALGREKAKGGFPWLVQGVH
jgi:hypothetical protein